VTATALPTVSNARTGVRLDNAPVAADATNGNVTPNDGYVFLYVVGGTAGGTIQVTPSVSLDGGRVTAANVTLTVTANQTALYGPFPTGVYGSSLNYKASVATILIAAVHAVPLV